MTPKNLKELFAAGLVSLAKLPAKNEYDCWAALGSNWQAGQCFCSHFTAQQAKDKFFTRL